ncbi:MAG TPA: Hsp20/alpha crystallin family protein [Bacteroidota bacterium]|nr:Hsp20/alpha crystallin family protein [Bacteroidota bacterium]
MSLIKRNPTKDVELWNREFPVPRAIDRLQREMNRAFDDFFRGDLFDTKALSAQPWSPAIDVSETKDSYVIHAELPGVKKDEVKITMHENLITIKGEKKSEEEKKGENYHRIERSYGSFERSFTLPGSVKGDAVEASYKDGVLTVMLPKTEESKEKVVDVKVK